MKSKNFLLTLGLFAIAALVVLPSNRNAFAPESVEQGMQEEDSSYPSVSYTFTDDTLTDTELDTLAYPYTLLSRWSYNWVLTTTRESGTGNPIIIYQESNDGTTYYEVARDTITATGTYRLNGDLIYGKYARLVLDGEGTAEHTYGLTFLAKRDY